MDSRHNIRLDVGDAEVIGYLAEPESTRGPLVVVFHEWMGLSEHIRGVCNDLASEGFAAFAPDLYGGRIPTDNTEASSMMDSLPARQVVTNIAKAIRSLLDRIGSGSEQIGVVGFSMGGAVLLVLAGEHPELVGAAVPYYGADYYAADLTRVSAPVLGHFGRTDPWAAPDAVDQLRARLEASGSPSVDLRIYDNTGHGFVVEGSPKFKRDLSDETWLATVEFLRRQLV